MPEQWTTTVSGTGNDTCDSCDVVNSTFTLDYIGDCTWQSSSFALCEDTVYWQVFFHTPDSSWELVLFGSGAGNIVYQPAGTWNCCGTNDMTLVDFSNECSWPGSITLNPVVSCSGDC